MIRTNIRRFFRLALRRRDRWEREVEDEIMLHLDLRAEQMMAAGASPTEAYDQAVRRFGPLTESRARMVDAARHREERMRLIEILEGVRQDISFALRTLARQKTWAAVVISTLALGIGATTAVFSVVSALLLHAVPYPNADRIVYVHQQPTTGNTTGISVTMSPSAEAVRAWREHSRTFEDLQPGSLGPRSLRTTSGEPSVVMTAVVLPTFATFAGLRPILGRMFTDDDIEAGGGVAVLGEGFWRERLGANPRVIGNTLTIGDSSYTIIGVMPAALRFGAPRDRSTDVWLPMDLRATQLGSTVIGRLRPGVTMDAARVELDSIFARSAGAAFTTFSFVTVVSTPAQRVAFRDSLFLLTGAVVLVLLVSCANVAHLMLARTATRRRELAIRAALGAGGGRLLRQLFTESFLVAGAGMLGGIIAGWVGVRALITMRPASREELGVAHLDATTLAVAVVVSLMAGLVFGIVGALQSRSSPHDSLKDAAASASGSRRHGRMRALLVVSEMAVSSMLIVGAALVIRSLQHLQSTYLGFDAAGLYTLSPSFGPRLETPRAQQQFLTDFINRVKAMPGVRSAAVVQTPPGMRSFAIGRLEVEGEPGPPRTASSFIDVNRVERTYFATMDIRLTQGRVFSDTTERSPEVIVNDAFARKHWPAREAVGKRIRLADGNDGPWLTIIGVARDALTSGPMSESSAPMLYLPSRVRQRAVIVRTYGNATSLAPAVAIGRELGAPEVSIDGAEALIEGTLSTPRFVMFIMTAFGTTGLLLAMVGLYGVLAYTVAQETRDIGIRVALGASHSRIARRVLVRGTLLAAAGVAAGLGAATWGTRLLENQLHGVERLDPSSFAIGAAVLIAGAVMACIVPTRRALAVDPITAIRE